MNAKEEGVIERLSVQAANGNWSRSATKKRG